MIYNKKEETVSGSSIYIDKKKRTVYYNKKKQQGFVITPGSERAFFNLSQRYLIGALLFIFIQIFLGTYFPSPAIALLVGAVAGLLASLYMSFKYKKLMDILPMIQNFDFKAATPSVKVAPPVTKASSFLKMFLYLLLAVLFIVNTYTSDALKDSIPSLILSYLAALASLGLCIKTFLLYQNRNK